MFEWADSAWWHTLWPILLGAAVTSLLVGISTWVVQERVGKALINFQTNRDLENAEKVAIARAARRARKTVAKPAADILGRGFGYEVRQALRLLLGHVDAVYLSQAVRDAAVTCDEGMRQLADADQAYRNAMQTLDRWGGDANTVLLGLMEGEDDQASGRLGGVDPIATFKAAEVPDQTWIDGWLNEKRCLLVQEIAAAIPAEDLAGPRSLRNDERLVRRRCEQAYAELRAALEMWLAKP